MAAYVCGRCDREVDRLIMVNSHDRAGRVCPDCVRAVLDNNRTASNLWPCCGGYGEHFDHCQVGADIATARQAIARSAVPTVRL